MFKFSFMKHLTMLALIILLLVGCGSNSAESPQTSQPPIFQCTVAYRQAPDAPIEDEFIFAIADFEQREYEFTNMLLRAEYNVEGGSAQPSFVLSVIATDIGSLLTRDLFQLAGVVPADQFAGDHGFSGLRYVYHPIGGDELQYFCKAVPR